MKNLPKNSGIVSALLTILMIFGLWGGQAYCQEDMPEAVRIKAPDGFSTPILSAPDSSARTAGLAFQGEVMEKVGEENGFVEVPLPEEGQGTGFIPKENTETWETPRPETGLPVWIIGIIGGIVIISVAGTLLYLRSAKKTQKALEHSTAISNSIRSAEGHFKAGEWEEAALNFQKYLRLQGDEVRNPDVYRRLTACYKNLEDYPAAAKAWDKMKSVGGLQNMDDYSLGVEIMMALGEEQTAASIYEQLLQRETSETKRKEIRKKLFDTYRKIKEPSKLLEHAVALLEEGAPEEEIVPPTVSFLQQEGRAALAVEAGNKQILMALRDDFLEEQAKTRDALRVYQKCLEFDRTNLDLHKMLAEIHKEEGNFKSAVMELTILQQLSKNEKTSYLEEAARIYVENSMVSEALAEGNPGIIKKIAQIYLARSEVNPDAVSVYEKVLEIQPNAVGVNKMLRTVYLTKGELEKYMQSLRHLHEIDGANHDYLGELAQCIVDNELIENAMAEGNKELNQKIIRKLLRKQPSDDKSVSLFQKLLKYEPKSVPIRKGLALAHEERGEKSEAAKQWLEIACLKPKDDEAVKKAVRSALSGLGHDVVIDKVEGKLLMIIAKGLVKKHSNSTSGIAIIQKAHSMNPKDPDLAKYISEKGVATPKHPPPEAPDQKPRPSTKAYTINKGDQEAPEESLTIEEEELVIESHFEDDQDGSDQEEVMTLDDPFDDSPAPQVITEAGPVTTFVSASERQNAQELYDESGLFKPATGGFMYKPLETIFEDGWGAWSQGKEVNTGRQSIILLINESLLKPDLMKDFVQGVSELGFNISHENILALGDVTTDETGRFGLVFSHMPSTLGEAIKVKSGIDINTGLKVVKMIVSGLAYAHNHRGKDGKIRRTFHLHLQPNHIFCNDDLSEINIGAVGFSQLYRNLTGAKQPRWESPGMNPAYAPPEFFSSQKGVATNERSADIYSLGVLMYEILANEAPFEGPDFEDYKMQHSKVFPAPPRLINQAIAPWLEPIILGCLEKEPERRWKSINDIELALNRKSS